MLAKDDMMSEGFRGSGVEVGRERERR